MPADEDAPVPDWSTRSCFYSITRTEQGLTVVCPAATFRGKFPRGRLEPPHGRGAAGILLPGIIASLTSPLSRARISVFVLSTYETDYLLVKQEQLENAVRVLVAEGFEVDAGTGIRRSEPVRSTGGASGVRSQ
jgi:hypothetical protein